MGQVTVFLVNVMSRIARWWRHWATGRSRRGNPGTRISSSSYFVPQKVPRLVPPVSRAGKPRRSNQVLSPFCVRVTFSYLSLNKEASDFKLNPRVLSRYLVKFNSLFVTQVTSKEIQLSKTCETAMRETFGEGKFCAYFFVRCQTMALMNEQPMNFMKGGDDTWQRCL